MKELQARVGSRYEAMQAVRRLVRLDDPRRGEFVKRVADAPCPWTELKSLEEEVGQQLILRELDS